MGPLRGSHYAPRGPLGVPMTAANTIERTKSNIQFTAVGFRPMGPLSGSRYAPRGPLGALNMCLELLAGSKTKNPYSWNKLNDAFVDKKNRTRNACTNAIPTKNTNKIGFIDVGFRPQGPP